ncbi:MAG: vitamin B12-dependent ribonucleotide reductase [Spirochaetes bacterium]|nr:vitamin B12-dependent ribonucleotide reductase [Spirochaetota bacterium]
MELSANARHVLNKRYLKRDDDGTATETPEDMFRRVAKNIAEADALYGSKADVEAAAEAFYDIMITRVFMPNSPTLMNAGRELQQLAACFVLPVEDSMEKIFESIKNSALIHKSGGGTGYSFSRLRPKNDSVKSTSGVSSGPMSFMKVFNAATEVIKQGGTRRGANMGILRIDHPDILEFITSKSDTKDLTNFNISVAVTDAFMKAVANNTMYDLINPRTKKIARQENAVDVFNLMTQLAWQNGEPGIVFIDRINAYNPTPAVGEIESTNPCGEQPLLPYEACNLGSLNVSLFVNDKKIDYAGMKKAIHTAVHFLDNVIDMSKYPLPEIDALVKANRKIGLGLMGFADMLYLMEVAYDSPEAEKIAREVMEFIQTESKIKSDELAAVRGTFPNYDKSIYKGKRKIRNATTTTIAPTGTISIIAAASSGIEPVFGLAFIRNVLDGTEMLEINPVFEAIAKREGFYSEDLMKKVAKAGTVKHLAEVPEKWRTVFRTSHDISPEWHIRLQAAFQAYTDNAVSKTINFPKTATVDDVKETYMMAYSLNCKGVTVYRDGSRENQVLNIGEVNKTGTKAEDVQVDHEVVVHGHIKPRERPKRTFGSTQKIPTACGNLYVTINEDDHGLCELFATIGKSGGCASSQAEGISRMISLTLRSGIEVGSVVKQLRGIRCTSPIWEDGEMILSCPDAIGRALDMYMQHRDENAPAISGVKVSIEERENEHAKPSSAATVQTGGCPECGGVLERSEGCMKCRTCGYSKCD